MPAGVSKCQWRGAMSEGQEGTDRIIADLEQGGVSWVQPWANTQLPKAQPECWCQRWWRVSNEEIGRAVIRNAKVCASISTLLVDARLPRLGCDIAHERFVAARDDISVHVGLAHMSLSGS